MSIGKATVIAVISGIIVLGSTIAVIKGTLSAGLTRFLAVLSPSHWWHSRRLIELALAVIATTAERGGWAGSNRAAPAIEREHLPALRREDSRLRCRAFAEFELRQALHESRTASSKAFSPFEPGIECSADAIESRIAEFRPRRRGE
jgi:hypothetical protein